MYKHTYVDNSSGVKRIVGSSTDGARVSRGGENWWIVVGIQNVYGDRCRGTAPLGGAALCYDNLKVTTD